MKTLGLGICNQRRVGQYYLSFNGIDALVDLGTDTIPYFDGTQDWSITTYLDSKETDTREFSIFFGDNLEVCIGKKDSNPRIGVFIYSTTWNSIIVPDPLTGWLKIVTTWEVSTNTLKLYVNREYIGSTSINDPSAVRNQTNRLCWYYYSAGMYAKSDIASVSIYQGVLQESEIQSLYGKGFIDDSRLVHRWDFSKGTGTLLEDKKGTVDGTISNATWQMGIIT